jgi:hypothetical protein
MPVGTHLPERGGIDEVDVPPNEFGESIFGAAASKPRQQFCIGRHLLLQLAPAGREFAREKPHLLRNSVYQYPGAGGGKILRM